MRITYENIVPLDMTPGVKINISKQPNKGH